MSTTRKSILIEKYIQFQKELEQQGINKVFPSLEDVDIVDLLFFFDLKFSNNTDYKGGVKELIEYSPVKITDEELDKVYPTIESFIRFILIDFKKL
jgi:hypothetical protein